MVKAIVLMDKKDHSELKDHSESKNHSELIPTNAGSVHAAGSHGNGSEAAGTLGLGDSFHFKDKISGSEHSDVVDDVGHTPGSNGHQDGGGRIVRTQSDGETSFIVTMDKKDHSELNDHSESKNHSESIPTNAGSVQAAGTHGNGSEAAGTLGLENYFTSRTRFPVLNFQTSSSSQMWATPQRRSVITKTLLGPTDHRRLQRKDQRRSCLCWRKIQLTWGAPSALICTI